MIKITAEEVFKIAEMSKIRLQAAEVPQILQQLEDVLSYAARVVEIAAEAEVAACENVNIFREDVVIKTDAESILHQMPQSEERYFVVPTVLEL